VLYSTRLAATDSAGRAFGGGERKRRVLPIQRLSHRLSLCKGTGVHYWTDPPLVACDLLGIVRSTSFLNSVDCEPHLKQ
jgi:hypothetical protein